MKSKNLRSTQNCKVLGLLLILAATTFVSSQSMSPMYAQEAHQPPSSVVTAFNLVPVKPVAAISWTCNGTIALTGTSYSYALPPWTMSGGRGADRQKKCKEYIQANWLNNGAIWRNLGIPAAQQDSYCKSGGTFRIDYGFDKRQKDWNFTQSVGKPACNCTGGIFP